MASLIRLAYFLEINSVWAVWLSIECVKTNHFNLTKQDMFDDAEKSLFKPVKVALLKHQTT